MNLLEKAKKSSGRFVEIGDGQFIALTQEFKKRLGDLHLFSEGLIDDTSDEILIHPLAALQLEKLYASNLASTGVQLAYGAELPTAAVADSLGQVPSFLTLKQNASRLRPQH